MPLKNLIRNPIIKLQKGSKRKWKSHLEKKFKKKKIQKPTWKQKTLKKARRNKKLKFLTFFKKTASYESQKSSPKMKMERYE
jgi:hypothetical protein